MLYPTPGTVRMSVPDPSSSFCSQPAHGKACRYEASAPYPVPQHRGQDHLVGAGLAGVAGQEGQDVELLGCEVDRGVTATLGLVVHQVQLERADA